MHGLWVDDALSAAVGLDILDTASVIDASAFRTFDQSNCGDAVRFPATNRLTRRTMPSVGWREILWRLSASA